MRILIDRSTYGCQSLKKPSLGQNVREIVYHKTPCADEEYRMGDYQRHLCDEDMQLVQAAVRNAGFVGQKADRVVNMLMQKTTSTEKGGTRDSVGYVGFESPQAFSLLICDLTFSQQR